jgi:hypothetical protein
MTLGLGGSFEAFFKSILGATSGRRSTLALGPLDAGAGKARWSPGDRRRCAAGCRGDRSCQEGWSRPFPTWVDRSMVRDVVATMDLDAGGPFLKSHREGEGLSPSLNSDLSLLTRALVP